MADALTTYDRAVERLFKAALGAARDELGGDPSDWRVTFEGPSHVVVKAWRGPRFGTFSAQLDPTDSSISTECYGMQSAGAPMANADSDPTPKPLTNAQLEAVSAALEDWLSAVERNGEAEPAQREHVRAFLDSLEREDLAARRARHDAEILFKLLTDPYADGEQLRDLAGRLAAYVHPRARRRFTRK